MGLCLKGMVVKDDDLRGLRKETTMVVQSARNIYPLFMGTQQCNRRAVRPSLSIVKVNRFPNSVSFLSFRLRKMKFFSAVVLLAVMPFAASANDIKERLQKFRDTSNVDESVRIALSHSQFVSFVNVAHEVLLFRRNLSGSLTTGTSADWPSSKKCWLTATSSSTTTTLDAGDSVLRYVPLVAASCIGFVKR